MCVKRAVFVYLAVLLVPLMCFCQGGLGKSALRFDRDVWDFGRIKEADGVVSHTFTFTNTGSDAVVIEHVSTSCGCTTPSYPKKPVKPGEKASIKVTFDPARRPGAFSKDVYIVSGGGSNRNTLTVKGEVISRPRTVEEDYPFLIGAEMRFNTLSVNYRYVGHGAPKSMVVGYANVSDKDVRLGFKIDPDNKDIIIDAPATVCAGCRGDITVTYHVPDGSLLYGRQSSRIYPVVNGKAQALSLSVTAVVTDNFESVDEAKAPMMKLDQYFYHFGDVNRGDRKTKEFTLVNEGKAALFVRAVELRKGASSTLKPGTKIAPGQSVKFTCTLDTSDADKGVVTALISLVTNDPSRPVRDIRLAANVK